MCFSSTCSHVVSLRRTAWKRRTVPGRGGFVGRGSGKGAQEMQCLCWKERESGRGNVEWRSKSLN